MSETAQAAPMMKTMPQDITLEMILSTTQPQQPTVAPQNMLEQLARQFAPFV
jgi:hypothetical protein